MRNENNRQASTTNNGTLAILTGGILVAVPYLTNTIASIYNLVKLTGASDAIFSLVDSPNNGTVEVSTTLLGEIGEQVVNAGALQIANLGMNTLVFAGASVLAYGLFKRGQAKAAQGADESSVLINGPRATV